MRGVSTITGKSAMIGYILKNIDKDSNILDVGFGNGLIGKILKQYGYNYVDGVDIYDGELTQCITNNYHEIFIKNILNFNFKFYDLIILGDILEHLTLTSAKKLLKKYIQENKCNHILISIPYVDIPRPAHCTPENKYEAHLQEHINREYMRKHYPYLNLLFEGVMEDYGGVISIWVWNQI